MASLKKVVITEFGDESKLTLVEADLTDPSAGEVQLAVEYSIVSGSDVNMRRGIYPFQKKAPLTPGYSVVGTVQINGADCSKFKLGARVACLSKYEGQAELINLPEKFLVPVPDDLDPKIAVSLVLDWVTAYEMLHRAARVQPGQQIFIHGLSGAVGGALLALAQLHGVKVYGTASPAKHEELRGLGAIPFDYANKQWMDAMRREGGMDAVFDPLGFQSFDESYSILRKGGVLVGYGMNLPALTGKKQPAALPVILKLLSKNLFFWTGKRTTFFGLTRSSKHYAADLMLLFEWARAKKVSVPIRAIFKLAEIQAAHREYSNGRRLGSIVIDVAR